MFFRGPKKLSLSETSAVAQRLARHLLPSRWMFGVLSQLGMTGAASCSGAKSPWAGSGLSSLERVRSCRGKRRPQTVASGQHESIRGRYAWPSDPRERRVPSRRLCRWSLHRAVVAPFSVWSAWGLDGVRTPGGPLWSLVAEAGSLRAAALSARQGADRTGLLRGLPSFDRLMSLERGSQSAAAHRRRHTRKHNSTQV